MEKRKIQCIKFLACIIAMLIVPIFMAGNSVYGSTNFKIKKDFDDSILEKYTGKEAVVKIPKGVTIINRAFVNNKKVKKVILSGTVKYIYAGAFDNCPNLKTVKFGKNLEFIEKDAFRKCPKIKKITINKKCSTVGEWAFLGCPNLKEITVEKGNKRYRVYNGVLYNKKKTEIYVYPGNRKGSTYVIPKSVKYIDGGAFVNSKYLKKVVFNGKVAEGDMPAFSGMKNLRTVVFKQPYRYPISFANCKKLKTVTLAEGTTTILQSQFEGCTNLEKINFPKSIKKIGFDAFAGCKKLVLPKFGSDVTIATESED